MNSLIAILISFFCWPIAVAVMVLASLRINLMRPRHHKFSWALMYMAYAAYAGAVLVYFGEHPPSQEALLIPLILMAGLLAIAANLWLTDHHWTVPPPLTVKQT